MEDNTMMMQETNNQQVGYQPPAQQYLPNPNGSGYYPVQEYGYPAPPVNNEESSARNTLLTLAVGAAIPTIIVVGGKVYKMLKNHFLKQADNQQRFASGNNGGMFNQYAASQAGQQFQQATVPQQPMQPVYTNVDAQAQQMRDATMQAAYQQPVQNVAPVQSGPVQQ